MMGYSFKENLLNTKYGLLRAPWIAHKRYYKRLFYIGETLYHYTDLNGLIGIIKGRGFWLSEAVFLNDSEELYNGVNLSVNLIDSLARKEKYKDFRDILILVRDTLIGKDFKDNYIASFSLKRDDLEQWRSYAKNGSGVCIGFNLKLKTEYPHFPISNIWDLRKVVYSDEVKKRILHSIIFSYFMEFKKDKQDGMGGDFYYEDYVDHLCNHLERVFLNFKNSSFSSEKEVRLVYDISKPMELFNEKKYRVVNNVVVPYVCTNDTKLKDSNGERLNVDRLPISEVIVGPTIGQKEKINSIKYLLDDLGYSDELVVSSSIPYRG